MLFYSFPTSISFHHHSNQLEAKVSSGSLLILHGKSLFEFSLSKSVSFLRELKFQNFLSHPLQLTENLIGFTKLS